VRRVDCEITELEGKIAERFRGWSGESRERSLEDHKEIQLVVFGARISRLG